MPSFESFLRNRFPDVPVAWRTHRGLVDGKLIKIAKEISTVGGEIRIKALMGPVEVVTAEAEVKKDEVILIPDGKQTPQTVEPGSFFHVGDHDTSLVVSVRRKVSQQTSEQQLLHPEAESQTTTSPV